MPDSSFPVRRKLATALGLAATLTSAGCLFQKPPRAYVAPPPQRPAPVKPPPLLDPPLVEIALVDLPELPWTDLSGLPPPPAPAPARRPPPPVATPKPTPQPSLQPEAPSPKITQLHTVQQTVELRRQIDESLDAANKALDMSAKKSLNTEQVGEVDLIKTFRQQAIQARDKDQLETAVELARRAQAYAKEFIARLQ